MKPLCIAAIAAVLLLVLTLPFIVRFVNREPLLFTGEPYYHLRLAETVKERGFINADPLLYTQRELSLNLYHLMLAAVFLFFGSTFGSMLVPFAAGLGSLFLFYKISVELRIRAAHRCLASIILLISPPFIAAFTISTPHSVAVFLNLLGFYMLLKKDALTRRLSLAVLALIPFVTLWGAWVSIVTVVMLSVRNRKLHTLPLTAVVVSVIVRLLTGVFLHDSITAATLSLYVSDLGGLYGLGAFNLLLAAIGLTFTWKRKRQLFPFYLGAAALIVLSLFNTRLIVYILPFAALLGAYGYLGLQRMRWELPIIKFLSLLVLLCGLLFSSISFMNVLVASGPHAELYQGLEWLSRQDTDVVLTRGSAGYWVQAVAGKTVLLDDMELPPQVANDSCSLFQSRNLVHTRELLSTYNISHILIDSEMRQGLVWKEPEEGLLFLFRNNETFKRIYHISGIEIWRVQPSGE
jgi:hypothetical protein